MDPQKPDPQKPDPQKPDPEKSDSQRPRYKGKGGKGFRKPGGPKGKGKFKGKKGPMKKKPSKPKKKVPPEALELAKTQNFTVSVALKVIEGKLTMEQALEENALRMKRREEAKAICEKYPEIDFALACLLLKEGTTPEAFLEKKSRRHLDEREKEVLKRKRMAEDASQAPAYQRLEKYEKEKTELDLMLYGGKFEIGRIEDFTPYDFYFAGKKNSKIHRLKIKYFCEKKDFPEVKKLLFVDKAIQKKRLRPTYGPEGRYKFPDLILKEGNEIMLALHEGEIIRGKIIWYTPYDILLLMGKVEVWIFRHSVMDCTLARKASSK